MKSSDLISPQYLAEQRLLHGRPEGYGGKGRRWSDMVLELAMRLPACQTILDYGCGQGSLALELRRRGVRAKISEYDPAIEGKDRPPSPAHLVVCTDVLEHVEPEKIDAVLEHLWLLSVHGLFVVISLVETSKTLSDGRQAHILLRTERWWREKMLELGWQVSETWAIKPDKQWVVFLTKRSK